MTNKIISFIADRLKGEDPGSKIIPTCDVKILLATLEAEERHYQTALRSDAARIEKILNACKLAVRTRNFQPIEQILEQENVWAQNISL